jgi:hypothetical protein
MGANSSRSAAAQRAVLVKFLDAVDHRDGKTAAALFADGGT